MDNGVITLANAGVRVGIAPFGATWQSFEVAVDGGWRNVILSRPDVNAHVEGYLGATVGRYANRIGGASFTLDGVRHRLDANEGKNLLHGGSGGFAVQRWRVESVSDAEVVLSHVSPDGDQGFPGELRALATFKLLENGMETIYQAWTNAPTAVCMTSHPYFNLAGSGVIDAHMLQIFASHYTPTDAAGIPTGEIAPLQGTALDFRSPREIGPARAKALAAGLLRVPGFDNNFCVDGYGAGGNGMSEDGVDGNGTSGEGLGGGSLSGGGAGGRSLGGYDVGGKGVDGDGTGDAGLRDQLRLTGPDGLTLTVRSNSPGIQFYDAAGFDGSVHSPSGVPYPQHAGLAVEPQHYPDSPNQPDLPSTILRPGGEYLNRIQWLVERP